MRRVAAAVAALVMVSGCATAGTPVNLATVTAGDRPLPVGVEVNPPATTGAAQPSDCDPTASLRPGALPPPRQMPSGSTMQKILQRGRLIAGVDQNTYLFGFRDPTTNALEGFDIDRAREIAAAIFGDPNKVQFRVLTSAQRIDALKNGDVDVVVRTMTATCARWDEINFSAIYYVAAQRLLVDKSSEISDIDQLGGQRVCAAKGSTSLARMREFPSPPELVAVDNWSDCLVLMQQGQVVGVSTDDTILAGMVAQDPNLKMVGPRIHEEPYGIGIPKENVDMVRFVNAVLTKSISSGAWQASWNRWLAQAGGRATPPTLRYRD
ncbi:MULTISPECIES: glutamate ABC transporter substrate-binding protein [Actinokineospora]|uniref:ABC transporter substrate-binding protein n=1 Tax=Actinokineospora fastidiosa TaxID=1816 RepID=A0A918G7F4_9PSEU|nr:MULTISPECIES: glutamate ABC transporter substrate-binding protein [Actinokineospora]UVS82418.1 ABC transporter glutamine-binding protein GlnH precursor [Actinokineospora sp. UTMC 2448]GGS21379.1 ABC transporter substrate-binding protein [Actinokineospora fastidiosa]